MTTSARHPSLRHDPCDLIAGEYLPLPGDELSSHNPARPGEIVWSASPKIDHVDRAVAAAKNAFPAWSRQSMEKRIEALRAYQEVCRSRVGEITALIQDEVGKANWEAKLEAGALAGKVDITLDDAVTGGLRRVQDFDLSLTDTRQGVCRFRPHGVMAVLGPFNFPAHLPNGHIVPALLMGNTIVLKPSDKTPAIGQILGELFDEALSLVGAPAGVVNVVQGGADPAVALVNHDEVDGILFTGSWAVGRRILEANLDRPGRVVALEMGGNNPAIVMDDADLRQAVLECARAAFNTTGQRCTCTRRILVHEKIADRFFEALVKTASSLQIGAPDADPPVFMGPIIDEPARQAALRFVDELKEAGGEVLLAPKALEDVPNGAEGHFVSPGIVRVDRFTRSTDGAGRDSGCDVEVFGPVVRVAVVSSYDDAIEQANATRYGLAASIFTQRSDLIERFLAESKAGCVNVNTGTAGASGKMPFGGAGVSGNHRPAGSFSVDYCAYPVASMVEQSTTAAPSVGMAFEDSWVV